MDELFEQFMIEGRELISQATDDLLALEREPGAAARIDSAFRAVHTLKGSVAIFDLAPMGAALHAAEDVLSRIRAAACPIEQRSLEALVACMDQCDRWMDTIATSGALPPEASKDAVRTATALAALTGGPREASQRAGGEAALWVERLVESAARDLAGAAQTGRAVAIRYTPRDDCFFMGDDPLEFAAQLPELIALQITARKPWPALDAFDPYQCNLVVEALSCAALPDVQQIFRFVPDQVELVEVSIPSGVGADLAPASSRETLKTMRVDAAQIDLMLDLVGEMVVAKNGLAHLARQAEVSKDRRALAAAIRATHASTDRLVSAMHRTVMNVRLTPLERAFRPLHRLVRETAAQAGREVDFSVHGAETRIDKSVADALFEPLLHIIRNAIDHGIETVDRRRELGKPDKGVLVLSARSIGDHILIEAADDGAGLDPAQIGRLAVARGLVPEAEAESMDDATLSQLIFLPGFSTAGRVTELSGRGVGMDAVKAAVERLGGRVGLASDAGKGTRVTLRLPATTALATILVVDVGGERFAVPLDAVVETLRVPAGNVLPVGPGRAFVHRDRTLPLLFLGDLLGLPIDTGRPLLSVLVTETTQGAVGLAVDAIFDRLDVMLRPMTGLLAKMPAVSGTTLLGDGSVLLILNLEDLTE